MRMREAMPIGDVPVTSFTLLTWNLIIILEAAYSGIAKWQNEAWNASG